MTESPKAKAWFSAEQWEEHLKLQFEYLDIVFSMLVFQELAEVARDER